MRPKSPIVPLIDIPQTLGAARQAEGGRRKE